VKFWISASRFVSGAFSVWQPRVAATFASVARDFLGTALSWTFVVDIHYGCLFLICTHTPQEKDTVSANCKNDAACRRYPSPLLTIFLYSLRPRTIGWLIGAGGKIWLVTLTPGTCQKTRWTDMRIRIYVAGEVTHVPASFACFSLTPLKNMASFPPFSCSPVLPFPVSPLPSDT
jgi:hypothetical protein